MGNSTTNSPTKIRKIEKVCSIDSMQIRVPLEAINTYSPSLTENTLHVTLEGEVLEEVTNNRIHRVGELGLSLQVKSIRHTGRENIACLVLSAPSKILGSRYFDGINQDTFKIIHDAIIDSGLADISLDALLTRGVATDFDIKQDWYLPVDQDFGEYCKQQKKQAKPNTDIGKGCKVYNNAKAGRGIQFSTRRTATASYPFLKLYDKKRELISKSLLFTQSYLSGFEIDRLIRSEVTVKNRQQFKRVIGHANNSLGMVLSLPSDELEKFISHAEEVHLNKVTATRNKTEKYTGMKLAIYLAMAALLEDGKTLGEVEIILLGEGREKKDKQRTRKLIVELYENYLSTKKVHQSASKVA